jgi:hypothetical protein
MTDKLSTQSSRLLTPESEDRASEARSVPYRSTKSRSSSIGKRSIKTKPSNDRVTNVT